MFSPLFARRKDISKSIGLGLGLGLVEVLVIDQGPISINVWLKLYKKSVCNKHLFVFIKICL